MLFLLTFLAMDGSTSDEHVGYTSWEVESQSMCELNSEYKALETEGYLELFVKGDMVNLRTGPSTSSKIQTEVRLGTVVTVSDCEKEETIGGKEGCWHPVSYKEKRKKKSGYLFSTALTDCRLEVDWDADGTMEYVYSSINSKGDLQIRIQDPNNAPHVFWETVQNVGTEDYQGVLSYVPAEQSGHPLVVVQDQGQDYCGGGSTNTYYSYDSKPGIQQAIAGHSYSDSPVYDERNISFSPDKKALVWDSRGEEDVRFEFSKEESHFVRWQKCAQEAKSCADAVEYAECLTVAQNSCAYDFDCTAVSVRKDPKGQSDAYVKYKESTCAEEHGYEDIHWDFFAKETFFEEVHTDNKRVKCLQDGVYKECPVVKFDPPKGMHLVEDERNIILRASADYELTNESGRDMTKEELVNNGMKLDEEWWVLPLTGPAVNVPVKRHFVSAEKMCGEWAAFYTTELEYSGEAISLAIQGTPPEIWNKPAPKSMFGKEVAKKMIDRQLPEQYRGMLEGLTLAEGKDGWQGFVELSCPEEPEEEQRYDDNASFQCQVSVSVSEGEEDEEVTFGEFKSVELEMGEPFIPLIRRDIDGDGVEEVFWSGCYDYWMHEGNEFLRNTGNCCGC